MASRSGVLVDRLPVRRQIQTSENLLGSPPEDDVRKGQAKITIRDKYRNSIPKTVIPL